MLTFQNLYQMRHYFEYVMNIEKKKRKLSGRKLCDFQVK